MLNTAYDPGDVRPPTPDASRVAAHEDTILYFGCRDLDGLHQHLRDQLYIKDPDGYSLCFQWSAA
jgi:glyoxylase I family protein